MAVSNAVLSMVRVLAIFHIVVGALLIIFGIADGVTTVLGSGDMFFAGYAFYGVWIGTWMCIAGGLGIPGSTQPRTQSRNCFAGIFMGFAITSAVLGGIIIIAYSIMIGNASYSRYYYGYNYYDYDPYGYPTTVTYRDHRYSYDAKMALAAVILILGIIEFGTGIWVSICLCVMKPCCTDYQQTGAFPGSTHGYAVVQGVDGAPLAVPVQACGVTVQTQPFYGYPQAGQTNIGGPVPFQAVANQPTGFPPQYTEKSQHVPPPEQI